MSKKILALLLSVCLAFPLFALAEEEDYELMSFNSAEYSEAVSFLITLGVLSVEDEYIKSEDWTVSRGEFVNLVLKCIGYSELAEKISSNGIYADVSLEHPYSKAIEFASQAGMFGKSKGVFFKPDAPLDSELAARMAVNITGQEIYLNGSENYLGVAYKAKLFKNVESYKDGKINRGNSLMFLKNLLCADVMTVSSITPSGSITVDLDSNETVISSYLKLDKRTGIVTSDGITTVFGDKASSGRITVDGAPYVCLADNYIGLAGKKITYYVEFGDDVIRAIDEENNSIITLDADSVISYNAASASYLGYIDGKQKSIPVSRDAYYVYNFEPGYSAELMKPESGAVTLIDHNSDSTYDVVLVQEFINTVVNTYSSYTETIYDEEESTYNIDLSEFRNYSIVDLSGNSVEPEALKQYSIVSLYKSADGKNARLVVSDSQKRGILSTIDYDNNVVTVGESDYQLSAEMRFDNDELKLGDQYEFYFDSFGEIAYIKVDSGIMTYLLKGGENGVLKPVVEVMALTESVKKIAIYNLAKKVEVIRPGMDDVTMKAIDVYRNVLLDGNGDFVRDMVLIKLNADEEIIKIVFPMEISSYDAYINAPQYPLYNLSYLSNDFPDILKTGSTTDPTLRFRSATGGFNRWIVLGSGAMMFSVPSGEDIDDPDSVVAKLTNYSGDDTEKIKELTFYSKDIDDVSVRYMVKKASAQVDFSAVTPGVITDMRAIYSEKLGGTVWRINISTMGGEKTYITKDEEVVLISNVEGDNIRSDKERVEIGDGVRFATDELGNVSKISLMWDAKAGINNDYNDGGDTSARFGALAIPSQTSWDQGGWSVVAGIVEKKSGNVLEYSIDKTETLQELKDRIQRIEWGQNNNAHIIDYSTKKPAVKMNASANELVKGDRIVIFTYAGQSYVLTAYRR